LWKVVNDRTLKMQSLLFWGLKAQISGLNYFSFFVSIAGMLTRTQASRPRTGQDQGLDLQGQGQDQGLKAQGQGQDQGLTVQGQGQDQGLDLQGQGQDQGPDQGLIITRTNSLLNTRNLTVTYTFVMLQYVKTAKKYKTIIFTTYQQYITEKSHQMT